MILIVGATGKLGGHVASQLLSAGHRVRAMTRDPARARALAVAGAEVVRGDLRDVESLRAATRGASVVVSASHSILGAHGNSSALIDGDGQRALINAATQAGVGHFVFTSALGASTDHPVDFWCTKARVEQVLADSGLHYSIIRPSAFMEMHAYELIGKAVVAGKRVVLFGRGDNPRNFVAAADVARVIGLALNDPRESGSTIEVGGPENLTSRQVVDVFEAVVGRPARVVHLPLFLIRCLGQVAQRVHPGVATILKAAVVGETTDQRFDPTRLLTRFPLRLTTLDEWVRAQCFPRPNRTTGENAGAGAGGDRTR